MSSHLEQAFDPDFSCPRFQVMQNQHIASVTLYKLPAPSPSPSWCHLSTLLAAPAAPVDQHQDFCTTSHRSFDYCSLCSAQSTVDSKLVRNHFHGSFVWSVCSNSSSTVWSIRPSPKFLKQIYCTWIYSIICDSIYLLYHLLGENFYLVMRWWTCCIIFNSYVSVGIPLYSKNNSYSSEEVQRFSHVLLFDVDTWDTFAAFWDEVLIIWSCNKLFWLVSHAHTHTHTHTHTLSHTHTHTHTQRKGMWDAEL